MDGTPVPSTSKERIIPIHIEGRDDLEEETVGKENKTENEKSVVVCTSSIDTVLETLTLTKCDSNEAIVKRSLPFCNAKEKIVIVVDSAEDENVTPFKLNNNNSHKPLDIIKSTIDFFVHTKNLINPHHEYAVMMLNENSAVWLLDFTNNVNKVTSLVQNVRSCEAEDIFDLNNLFEVINDHVQLPEEADLDEMLIPPPYVVRTILFYGRSYTLPKLQKTREIQKLLDSPYFTLDVLMTHEPVDIDNNCNKIFSILQSIDTKGFAYFFSVCRDLKALHDSTGKLLAHPLQRPLQKHANYTLEKLKI